MNRKKTSKLIKSEAKKTLHPLDSPREWVGAEIPSPWTDAQMSEYQKKLDSAFGAENAIILAWSGDQRYWDGFYSDWFVNGEPKQQSFEKKPILLFGKYDLSPTDYYYVSVPRFLLLEVHHRSQYEGSWGASAYVADKNMTGGRKRIRAIEPPQFMYHVLKTIAVHDKTLFANDLPPCCHRMMTEMHRICYGSYKPPSDTELAFIRNIREGMDRDGVFQRNDEARSEKLLERAAASTRFYIKQAERQQMTAVKELMMSDPQGYMADVLKNRGITLSAKEIEVAMQEGFDQEENDRFGDSKQI